jgi:hypothetical protein
VLHDGELGTQIGISSPEALSALVAELSTLERSLVEKGIHLESLDISQGFASGSGQPEERFRDQRSGRHQGILPKARSRRAEGEAEGLS